MRVLSPLMGLLRSAQTSLQERRYKRWQKKNPAKPFSDFFAEIQKPGLLHGRSHPTLGSNLTGLSFGQSGIASFNMLTKNGLTEDTVCVDYGCGTLRIGVHVIKHLGRGAYWGFDIDEAFLDKGRELIGAQTYIEKAPHLRVVSPASVAEVAAAKPTFLFSISVMIHVHPNELEQYFQNIMTIIGDSGRAIVSGKWSQDDTRSYSSLSWAHSMASIHNFVVERGWDIRILHEGAAPQGYLDQRVRKGVFLITKMVVLVVGVGEQLFADADLGDLLFSGDFGELLFAGASFVT
jgi:SAM-dependent methyltransferase